jgi:hypothetical protein
MVAVRPSSTEHTFIFLCVSYSTSKVRVRPGDFPTRLTLYVYRPSRIAL